MLVTKLSYVGIIHQDKLDVPKFILSSFLVRKEQQKLNVKIGVLLWYFFTILSLCCGLSLEFSPSMNSTEKNTLVKGIFLAAFCCLATGVYFSLCF